MLFWWADGHNYLLIELYLGGKPSFGINDRFSSRFVRVLEIRGTEQEGNQGRAKGVLLVQVRVSRFPGRGGPTNAPVDPEALPWLPWVLRKTVPRISETRTNLDENLSFYILIKIPKNVLKLYGDRNNKWLFRREIKEIIDGRSEWKETVDESEI